MMTNTNTNIVAPNLKVSFEMNLKASFKSNPKLERYIPTLATIPEETDGPSGPSWDRTVDVIIPKFPQGGDAKPVSAAVKFKKAVVRYYMTFHHQQDGANEAQPLFKLPEDIRLKIYSHVLEASSSQMPCPIRMGEMSLMQPVWPEGYFQTLQEALAPGQGALESCFALRAELMAALFTSRRFHVTLSPYVSEPLFPLTTTYISMYGCLMENVTLEMDFTKLGYGPDPSAVAFGPGTLNMRGLVSNFVGTIKKRGGEGTKMNNLVILCRRFYGNRPIPNAFNGSRGMDFASPSKPRQAVHVQRSPCSVLTQGCPENHLEIKPYVCPKHEEVAELLTSLRGLLESVRLVGFSEAFTSRMICLLHDGMPNVTAAAARERHV